MNHDDEPMFTEADLIHAYTRADALADGVLIDLPQAQTMGFILPMAITAAAHEACIAWPQPGPRQQHIVSLRAEGVLLATSMAGRTHRRRARAGAESTTDHLVFHVNTVAWREGRTARVTVPLRLVIGPGDHLELVGTLMLLGED
ncbi:DUF6573 family protein [Xanthomonas sp. NCPPB 2632]|uniref:DUF6573 family protein n=1 Tax=Xanthomonas sp. NCPPB 2632 TaxID=3240912 RepID=UPI003511C49B